MKRKETRFVVLLAAGVCLAGAALVLQKTGIPDSLGGMLMGLGSGLFGLSAAMLLSVRQERKNPALARQNEISRKDERNTAMRNRAKALAGDVLQWAVMAAAWMAVGLGAPLWVPVLSGCLFAAKAVLEALLLARFQREM